MDKIYENSVLIQESYKFSFQNITLITQIPITDNYLK